MGILFLASVFILMTTGITTLASCIRSFKSNGGILAYWIIAAAGIAVSAYASFPLTAPKGGGEYAALAKIAEASFSLTNAISFIGSTICLALARTNNIIDRSASGLSWAFLLSFSCGLAAYIKS